MGLAVITLSMGILWYPINMNPSDGFDLALRVGITTAAVALFILGFIFLVVSLRFVLSNDAAADANEDE